MIASKIKCLRRRKKLSQEKLAWLANISYNTFVKIETGATPNPGIKTVLAIAKTLGMRRNERADS